MVPAATGVREVGEDMATDTRRRLQALLDELQGDELVAAQAYLESLVTRPDRIRRDEVSERIEITGYEANYEEDTAGTHATPHPDRAETEAVNVPNIWPDHVDPVQAAMDAAPDEDEELSAEERYKLAEATERGSGPFHPHISHDDLGRILGA